jgi:hypothetical protein
MHVSDDSDSDKDQLSSKKGNPAKSAKAVLMSATKAPGTNKINMHFLANRVLDCRDIIDPLMDGPEGRKNVFVWNNLMDEFKVHGCTAAQLNKGKKVPFEIVNAARTGMSAIYFCRYCIEADTTIFNRYGEQGATVIRDTLEWMYNYTSVKTPASSPLTLETYTTYVLIPYIAAWLIGDEMGIDVDGGWEAMQWTNALNAAIPLTSDVTNHIATLETPKTSGRKPAVQKGKKGKENAKPAVCSSSPTLYIWLTCSLIQGSATKAKVGIKKAETRATRSTAKAISTNDFLNVSSL